MREDLERESRIKLPVYINPDYKPGSRRRIARGSYIRTWMRKLHLDYDTVAKVLGVHPITVRNWEKAKSVRPIVKMAFDTAFRSKPAHPRVTVPLVPDPYAPKPEYVYMDGTGKPFVPGSL